MIYVYTYYTWKKIVFSSLARAFKDQVLRRSFLYTHTCRLPAGTTAAIVVCTVDRTRYTHTTYNGRMGTHNGSFNDLFRADNISTYLFIGSVYIIYYYFGFTGDDASRDSRSMEKKLKPRRGNHTDDDEPLTSFSSFSEVQNEPIYIQCHATFVSLIHKNYMRDKLKVSTRAAPSNPRNVTNNGIILYSVHVVFLYIDECVNTY